MRDLFSSPGPEGPINPQAAAHRHVYTVDELNREIQRSLQGAFPETIWVRGEIQRLAPDAARRKHNYFELHGSVGGSAVAIPIALLDWDRQRYGLGSCLDGSDPDFRLANKIEVCLQCVVDFYPPYGKLQLKMVGVDKSFTLGRLEARRREVLAYLKSNDLLDRNARLPWPRLPLHIGLITSRGSAAEKDFLKTLADAPFGFRIISADCRMMGENMAAQIIAAVQGLSREDVDLIVITRGGGSKADLSFFDQQDIAVAIANCSRPVITAIGHEIDHSIADTVAHHFCRTPTAAAQELVGALEEASLRLDHTVDRFAILAARKLDSISYALESIAALLKPAVLSRVRQLDNRLLGLRDRTLERSFALLSIKATEIAVADKRLERALNHLFSVSHARLEHLRQKTDLLDPVRLLARGWSLTFDDSGRVLRSITDASAGTRLLTRLADGEIESIVADVYPSSGRGENT